MKKLIFYLSNNNECFKELENELFEKLNAMTTNKKGKPYTNPFLFLHTPEDFEENMSHYDRWYNILEANSETPAIIKFPEYFASIAHQLSFIDILCSSVLPDRKAPIYIFTHSETIVEKAICETDLTELAIIWLYEIGGVEKQYTFSIEDIKDVLNEDITIWLNMLRYLPEEDNIFK